MVRFERVKKWLDSKAHLSNSYVERVKTSAETWGKNHGISRIAPTFPNLFHRLNIFQIHNSFGNCGNQNISLAIVTLWSTHFWSFSAVPHLLTFYASLPTQRPFLFTSAAARVRTGRRPSAVRRRSRAAWRAGRWRAATGGPRSPPGRPGDKSDSAQIDNEAKQHPTQKTRAETWLKDDESMMNKETSKRKWHKLRLLVYPDGGGTVRIVGSFFQLAQKLGAFVGSNFECPYIASGKTESDPHQPPAPSACLSRPEMGAIWIKAFNQNVIHSHGFISHRSLAQRDLLKDTFKLSLISQIVSQISKLPARVTTVDLSWFVNFQKINWLINFQNLRQLHQLLTCVYPTNTKLPEICLSPVATSVSSLPRCRVHWWCPRRSNFITKRSASPWFKLPSKEPAEKRLKKLEKLLLVADILGWSKSVNFNFCWCLATQLLDQYELLALHVFHLCVPPTKNGVRVVLIFSTTSSENVLYYDFAGLQTLNSVRAINRHPDFGGASQKQERTGDCGSAVFVQAFKDFPSVRFSLT